MSEKRRSSMPDKYLKRLALLMAVNCVRNTIIEDYHARGSLSQTDMKTFNKEVADKIYTFLHFMFKGTLQEAQALFALSEWSYPSEWDQPVIDAFFGRAIKFWLNNPEIRESDSKTTESEIKVKGNKRGAR